MDKLLKIIGGSVSLLILLIYGVWVWAFVAFTCYNWFLLGDITHIPISMIEFAGIRIILVALFPQDMGKDEIKKEYKEQPDKYVAMLIALLTPWAWLFFAYIIHLFI